jgi:hypothetical protein
MENSTENIKQIIREWISFDDQTRELTDQIKKIREQKDVYGQKILQFMRDNQVDNFSLEGNGLGTLSRNVRTSKPPLKRKELTTQLFLHFGDKPQEVAQVLRRLNGIADDADDTSVGIQREILSRRIPKK